MTDCDMCGKSGASNRVLVETTEMTVCNSCKSFGKVLVDPRTRVNNFTARKSFQKTENTQVIVEDYASRIKQARERLKLTQSEFATKISEKESVLHRFESGHAKPNLATAKKIERICHIQLIEEDKQKSVEYSSEPVKELTMEQKVLAALKKKSDSKR